MEINNTDVENLSAWIASQNDELERLRAFARVVLELPMEIAFVSRLRELATANSIIAESLKAHE